MTSIPEATAAVPTVTPRIAAKEFGGATFGIGVLLVLVGLGVIAWATFTDATFESDLSRDRVYNIGLVYDHLRALIGGCTAVVLGSVLCASVRIIRNIMTFAAPNLWWNGTAGRWEQADS